MPSPRHCHIMVKDRAGNQLFRTIALHQSEALVLAERERKAGATVEISSTRFSACHKPLERYYFADLFMPPRK